MGSFVSKKYLKRLGLNNKNSIITEKTKSKINEDVKNWFNDNYKNIKPTLDYLKDK